MTFLADPDRYDRMTYRRTGRSGLDLPALSLGLWHNFGALKDLVAGMEDDFGKFYDKGNKAAGTRIRKSMQDLKKMAQDIRSDVQDSKNTPA